MFGDIMQEVLEAFADAATLGGRSLADDEIDSILYRRMRNRDYQREHRARLPRLSTYVQRTCKWCRTEFTVVLYARPGRVKEYCCKSHQQAAADWRCRNKSMVLTSDKN